MTNITPSKYLEYRNNAVEALTLALDKWQELKLSQHKYGQNTDFKASELFNIIEIVCTDNQILDMIGIYKNIKGLNVK